MTALAVSPLNTWSLLKSISVAAGGSRQRNGILDCAETPGESHGWPHAFKTLARSIWSLTVSLPPPRRAREDAPGCDECIQRRKWKQEHCCFREGLCVWGPDCSLSIHFMARHWLLFLVHYCLHEWMSINNSNDSNDSLMMTSVVTHLTLSFDGFALFCCHTPAAIWKQWANYQLGTRTKRN